MGARCFFRTLCPRRESTRGERANGDLAPVGFDNSFSNCHAQAGAFGFGGIERLENPLLLFRGQAWALVAHDSPPGWLSPENRFGTTDGDLDGVAAGSQGVFQNVAEDLFQAKMVNLTFQVQPPRLFAHGGGPTLPAQGKIGPGLAPNARQVPMFPLQFERGSIAAHLF